MRRIARAIATVVGIGYLPKAPGTAGSLAGLLLGWFWPGEGFSLLSAAAVGAAIVAGAAAATAAERDFRRHDPSCIVIDETVGMWIVMLLRPFAPLSPDAHPDEKRLQLLVVPLAFVLFRFFDIAKPLPLKRLARLPEGWGIMMDDVGASLYALLILWAAWLAMALFSGALVWQPLHR